MNTRLPILERLYELKRQEIEPLRQRRNGLSEQLLRVSTRAEFDSVCTELDMVEAEFATQMMELKQIHNEINAILMSRGDP